MPKEKRTSYYMIIIRAMSTYIISGPSQERVMFGHQNLVCRIIVIITTIINHLMCVLSLIGVGNNHNHSITIAHVFI